MVMPAGLLGLAAMPFGFDGVFWQLMGWGIDWMVAVAQWFAALPGSIGRMAAFGTGPAGRGQYRHHPARPAAHARPCASAEQLRRWLARWSGRWRRRSRDILISRRPAPSASVAGTGACRSGAAREIPRQLSAEGMAGGLTPTGSPAAASSLAEGVSCDGAGCVAQLAGGGLVALALRPTRWRMIASARRCW